MVCISANHYIYTHIIPTGRLYYTHQTQTKIKSQVSYGQYHWLTKGHGSSIRTLAGAPIQSLYRSPCPSSMWLTVADVWRDSRSAPCHHFGRLDLCVSNLRLIERLQEGCGRLHKLGGPFCGCPYKRSSTISGLEYGPDFWKLPHGQNLFHGIARHT